MIAEAWWRKTAIVTVLPASPYPGKYPHIGHRHLGMWVVVWVTAYAALGKADNSDSYATLEAENASAVFRSCEGSVLLRAKAPRFVRRYALHSCLSQSPRISLTSAFASSLT